jgi:hypothetical protein
MKSNTKRQAIALGAWVCTAVLAAGCATSKSSDPLSPSVAGPLPGVDIVAPKVLEPGNGMQIPIDKQPVTLLIENGSSSGKRPLTYDFEVATDAGFGNKVFARGGVAAGEAGRTSLQLPDALASGRTYFWRTRAEDGANASNYSDIASFNVFTPVALDAPVNVAPGQNSSITSTRTQFVINNSARTGPVGGVAYTLEIATNFQFTANVAVWSFPEQPGQSRLDVPVELQYSTVYYWHVRAYDQTMISEWSTPFAFATPAAPVVAPPPGGGGGGPVGDWRSCGSTPGAALVQCVHRAVNPGHTVDGAFEVTKRVAWLLRGSGVGLLLKPGGENIVSWNGHTFAAARVCYPDGHIYKVLSDVPTTNGPSWQDNDFVDRSLYFPAIDPGR